MRQDDFDGFKKLMRGVHDFYGKDLSSFALDVWWGALKNYELQVISQALTMHCQNPDTGQWCPKPADVVRMVGGTTKDAALMAWNKVQEAVSKAGAFSSVCFDDAIINRCLLDMGGWPDLCAKQMDELPFVERNFCDRYRAYKIRGDAPGHPPYLVGLHEAMNSQKGFQSAPPMLIGNPERAQIVLTCGANTPLIPVTLGEHVEGVTLRLVNRASDAA